MFDPKLSPRVNPKLNPSNAQQPSDRMSVISSDLTITGSIDSEGSVTVEGTINGDVNCKNVLIKETGNVEGSLTAEAVDIYGSIEGTITGDRVSLRDTSKVLADIHHDLIELEMGTEFSGELKRKKNQT